MVCKYFGVLCLVMLAPTWCKREARIYEHESYPEQTHGEYELQTLDDEMQNLEAEIDELTEQDTNDSESDPETYAQDAIAITKSLTKDLLNTNCDLKEEMKQGLAELRSRVGQAQGLAGALTAKASSGTKLMAEQALESFHKMADTNLASLRTSLVKHDMRKDLDNLEQSLLTMKTELKNLVDQNGSLSTKIGEVRKAISNFCTQVSDLSVKIEQRVQSEEMQAALTAIQSQIGQLISTLDGKYSGLESIVTNFAEAARNRVSVLKRNVLESVKECMPNTGEKLEKVLDTILDKTGQLFSKIGQRIQWREKLKMARSKLNILVSSLDVGGLVERSADKLANGIAKFRSRAANFRSRFLSGGLLFGKGGK